MMKKTKSRVTSAILGAAVLLLAATLSCRKSGKSSGNQTFYDSLGGTSLVADPANFGQSVEKGYLTIRTIVDTALFIIQVDPTINGYFSIMVAEDTAHATPTEYDKLSFNITNFLAAAAGSKDYSYNGPTLMAAHNPTSNPNVPAAIDSAAFNEFAFDLGRAAAQAGLSNQLISQLGDLLYRYEDQVVQP